MPMLNSEVTGFPCQCLNTVANSVTGSGKGRTSPAAKLPMATQAVYTRQITERPTSKALPGHTA